ncbi:hypothetical protein CYMTET_12020 [Cymbomonas tetramitiformis]|uniref:DUF819 family protein n=1 Tax=Cymbomonas tetramitiformis TaxID=36881 RepID=A0AAE0LCW1_9CHLO|nr:hypothetical protein CYMTET_12020 [Cymbomonas tetramitiformis]
MAPVSQSPNLSLRACMSSQASERDTFQHGTPFLPSGPGRSIGFSLLVASLVCMLADATATACGIPSAALGLVGLMASGVAMITAEVRAWWSRTQSAGLQIGETAPVVQIPVFAGADSLGSWAMMCFFSSVGAKANLWEAVSCGGPLLLFISILLMVHLVVAVSLGKLLGLPIRAIVIASNANVGGPATAAAMATSQRWPDMVQPALVTGTFGYSVGTVIACIVAKLCLAP